MTRRHRVLIGVLMAMLILTALWSYQYMLTRRDAALAAAEDLREGLSMMRQIEQMSRRPALASDHERLLTETTGLITTAATAAGIAPDSLVRFTPEAPRRIGESVYKEKPTQVWLQAVTLRQLVDLASAEALREAGLNVESIRVTAPPDGREGDQWNVDLVLSYLVYDPPKAGK